MDSITELKSIVAKLRSPEGCPWDQEQTHESIRSQLIEETYEVIEAIDTKCDQSLREELGDVLLHIVFHAQLAEERNAFDLAEVAKGINEKLIRRHPHVFGEDQAEDSAAVLKKWDELKKLEKPERTSVLDGIPASLPSLMKAQELQKKAAKIGFDWKVMKPVIAKIREELDELEADLDHPERAADEMGDVFFSLVNLCRHLKLDAEQCTQQANQKFERRFRKLESLHPKMEDTSTHLSLEELDRLWEKAKEEVG
ncbi:MAG: nucleoside triphosphate pyrophosphohydrolase [Verrucomicrobiota bacterium]